MSYCRLSTDDFKCDLYVYKSCDGYYSTNVASMRVVGEIPHVDQLGSAPYETIAAQYSAQMAFLDTCARVKIGLPYDGQSFADDTLEELLARLLHLREVGYHFPDYVIERIQQEMTLEVTP